ncbi:MAG: hypothetical protein CMH94_06665 [Oceanicaulis sp.]|nr:hypothetical protein [Oceanicaulis sp.]MAZ92362.1 hypothetical protein [Maricaulis sp.]MBI75270.1 hypothetical protein [Oceanicaulis sp.]|tara:strand:- start:300 stop:710 length:411 start_codon:yes stop_codon:yes gene_type:complete
MFDIVVAALLIGEPAAVDTSAIQYEELQCIQAPHGYQRQIAYRNNAQPDRFVWVDVARRNVSYLFDLSSQCDAGRPGRIAIPEAGILNLCVGRNIFASSSEIPHRNCQVEAIYQVPNQTMAWELADSILQGQPDAD